MTQNRDDDELTRWRARDAEIQRWAKREPTPEGTADPLERRLLAARQARIARERAADERREKAGAFLYARASEAALAFWQRFVAGFAGSARPCSEELDGRDLAKFFPDGRPSVAAKQARLEWTTR